MANPIALITGATSGIGAAFAEAYASRGHDLILTGRRMDKLNAIAQRCRDRFKVMVETVSAELTNGQDVAALAEKIKSSAVDVLVNNAGFGKLGPFSENAIESQIAMLDVHARATVVLTHAAVGRMKERRSGAIVNVASIAGFLPMPSGAMYSSTKSFLVIFTESLSMELRPFNIRVQALCPGFTHTDFHEKIDIPRERQKNKGVSRWMEPGEVVACSLRALDRGKAVCVPGFWNRALLTAVKLAPRWLYHALFPHFSRDDLV
jgi:uncharacterized protein